LLDIYTLEYELSLSTGHYVSIPDERVMWKQWCWN